MRLISFKNSLIAALGLLLSAGASANLLVNGGFEDNDVNANSWKAYNSSDVAGWDGSRIEIWDTFNGVLAAEGSQHAELNADPNSQAGFTIFQNFNTVVGQQYDVSFYYRARANNNEVFEFSVGGLGATMSDHTTSSWSMFHDSFVASDWTSTIRFTTVTTGTIGNFLDGVSVTSSVPAPGTLALVVMGLFGLGAARRRVKN